MDRNQSPEGTGAVTVYFVVRKEQTYSAVFRGISDHFPVQCVLMPSMKRAASKPGVVLRVLTRQLFNVPRLVRLSAPRGRSTVFVCQDSHYAALFVAKVLPLLGRDIRVYLLSFYLHELGRSPLVKAALKWLLSSRVALFVQSPDEIAYYRALSRQVAIDCHPFYQGEITSVPDEDVRLGDYVFAGGYADRDYDTVLRVASDLSNIPFVIVCAKANRLGAPIPLNVTVQRDVDARTFHALLAGSRCVVMALKGSGGSAGQMVTLAAMQFGKLVLYADTPAVSQYFVDGSNGISYQPGNQADLKEKLAKYYPDTSTAALVGTVAARRFRTDFSVEQFHARQVSDIVSWVGHVSNGDR